MANVIDYMIRGRTDSAERGLDRVAGKMDRLRGGVLRLAGSLGLAFGAGGLLMAGRNALNTADQMEKLERRLGITTEALSELKFAGEQSGIGFNTLTMGIQRMTRRVAEAAAGTGEARTALLELGLDAEKLAKLAPDQQFEMIAEAMSGVSQESDRTRLAMKLFDSEGVALLQTMQGGAAEIRNLRNEARQLGVTLSHEDAVAAAEANDAMNRLKSSMNALTREAAINLAPGLADLANQMSESIPGAVKIAISGFHRLESGMFDVIGTGATMLKLYARMKAANPFEFAAQRKEAKEFADTMEAFANKMRERSLNASAQAADVITDHFTAPAREMVDVIGPAVEDTTSEYGRLTFAQAQLAIQAENAAAKMNAMGDTSFIEKLSKGLEIDIGQTSENVFDQMRNSFKSTLVGMFNDLINSQLRSGFMSIFGGIFGGGSALQNGAPLLTAGLNSTNSSIVKAFGFASGGSFTVGQGMGAAGGTDRRLVQFAATDGETVTVTPASSKFRGSAQAGGDTYIFNFENNVESGVDQQQLRAILQANNARVKADIAESMRLRHARRG